MFGKRDSDIGSLSATAHQCHDFDLITRLKWFSRMLLSRNDIAIAFDRTITVFNLQIIQQVCNCPCRTDAPGFAVQLNDDECVGHAGQFPALKLQSWVIDGASVRLLSSLIG